MFNNDLACCGCPPPNGVPAYPTAATCGTKIKKNGGISKLALKSCTFEFTDPNSLAELEAAVANGDVVLISGITASKGVGSPVVVTESSCAGECIESIDQVINFTINSFDQLGEQRAFFREVMQTCGAYSFGYICCSGELEGWYSMDQFFVDIDTKETKKEKKNWAGNVNYNVPIGDHLTDTLDVSTSAVIFA